MEILFFYIFGFIGFVILAVFFYMIAKASRKKYRCPHCGEKLSTEFMDAKRCNVCGAPLEKERGGIDYD